MADRRWDIRLDEYVDEDAFRAAVREALVELEAIGERMGCGFVVGPMRLKGDFTTRSWAFRTAVLPAVPVRAQGQEPAEELPEPLDPEPAGDAENGSDEPVEGEEE